MDLIIDTIILIKIAVLCAPLWVCWTIYRDIIRPDGEEIEEIMRQRRQEDR